MALLVNIDDLVNHQKVEWARIKYKEGWNPEKVLHTLCAFANDTNQYHANNRHSSCASAKVAFYIERWLLVREGGDKDGKWIVKKGMKRF